MEQKKKLRSYILKDKRIKGLALGALFIFLLWAFPFFVPLDMKAIRQWPISRVALDRYHQPFFVELSSNSEWCIPVSLQEMGPWVPKIAVAIEDRKFWSHHGVNLFAIGRAAIQNMRTGKIVSGASTISSQVIRLTYPRPRKVSVKIAEFLQAMKLERLTSKENILEIYLNKAPFGSNIRGIEAASRIWYGKPASTLSSGEAALLIGMLRGPSLYRPDRNPEKARGLRNHILSSLRDQGILSPEEAKIAMEAPVPSLTKEMPTMAFHFANQALNLSEKPVVSTTLDRAFQYRVGQILHRTLNGQPSSITGSALVIHNSTGEIRAYVGNGRLGSGTAGSWVDCCQTLRSPGSALKPFAYIEAFSRGLLTPASLLADTPFSFGGHSPRNFDLKYRGPVSARQALANSLNAPAVRVLRMVGGEPLLQSLRSAGFSSLKKDASYYGDSLILGGCEVSVMEMALAYETLANLGRQHPLRLLSDSPFYEKKIYDEPSSFLIADILKDSQRLLPMRREALLHLKKQVAFKTGTSYGFRDAWTAAYTPEYTVVVWFGDPEGFPNANLVGLNLATPVALEILFSTPETESSWYPVPGGLALRSVCALSGLPPSESCPVVKKDWHIPGVSRSNRCPIHQMRQGQPVLIWPPELAMMNPSLPIAPEEETIVITSPLAETRFLLTPEGGRQKIALRHEGTKGRVFWYVDGEYYGETKAPELLFWELSPGHHSFAVMNEKGQNDRVDIEVLTVTPSRQALPSLETLELY